MTADQSVAALTEVATASFQPMAEGSVVTMATAATRRTR
jgi:hypothetical protein